MENFTRIDNSVLQALIGSGLNGTELACALFAYRKTFGWNKKQDAISIPQFAQAVGVSERSIKTALKRLRLVKILSLVKKGSSIKGASIYAFNANIASWKLVKKTSLVKNSTETGEEVFLKLVKKTSPTKDTITKETIQKKERKFFLWKKESEQYALAEYFKLQREQLFGKDPNKPNIQAWAGDMNKILNAGFSSKQIMQILEFAFQDTWFAQRVVNPSILVREWSSIMAKGYTTMNKRQQRQEEEYKAPF